jgi:hypothetical protein
LSTGDLDLFPTAFRFPAELPPLVSGSTFVRNVRKLCRMVYKLKSQKLRFFLPFLFFLIFLLSSFSLFLSPVFSCLGVLGLLSAALTPFSWCSRLNRRCATNPFPFRASSRIDVLRQTISRLKYSAAQVSQKAKSRLRHENAISCL